MPLERGSPHSAAFIMDFKVNSGVKKYLGKMMFAKTLSGAYN